MDLQNVSKHGVVTGEITYQDVYSGWNPPPVPERLLINVLKLSNRWLISEGQNYAILFLDKQILHPARRLELSRMYQINAWVKPAFEALVRMELRSLPSSDVNRIGFTAYVILAKAREAIDYQRKLVAAVPHTMTFTESYKCAEHDRCKESWNKTWWRKLGKQLLHPTKPLALNGALDFLERTKHDDMTPCCKVDMMEEMRVYTTAKFGVEEEIIDAAVLAIITYHSSL